MQLLDDVPQPRYGENMSLHTEPLSHFYGFQDGDEIRFRRHMNLQVPPARPAIRLLENVYTEPASGGLYFSTGQAIPETFNSFIPRDALADPKDREFVEAKLAKHWPSFIEIGEPDHFKRQVFWGGELTDHYGHFLCESMTRMWALPMIPRKATIMFTARGNTKLETPFIQEFLRALGVINRVQIIDTPLRLKNAYVAEPALQHVFRLYSEFAQPHEQVGRVLDDGVRRDRPVYLSRSKFKGRNAGSAEAEVEEYLVSKGVEVVHPELLTLKQQISIFRNAPVVIGLMGSAFHTSLFTEAGKAAVMVQLTWEKANRRFLQFDQLKRTSSHYLHCTKLKGYREGIELDSKLAISLLEKTGIL